MFLNEVALGKQYKITKDDSSLVEAPKDYDSVLACGRTEPGKYTVYDCWQITDIHTPVQFA